MLRIKLLVRKIILYIYWSYKNFKDDINIRSYQLSPRSKIGKNVFIRGKNEIGYIEIGDYSYISGPRSFVEEAIIGKYCSIARQVVIGVSGHNYNWLTTSPIIASKLYGFIDQDRNESQKAPPVIGNDVWIGMSSIIMRGVTIGDGAVIAAGSIVTSDVKPYSIVGGLPAKFIKYRFTETQIQKLLEIKWWNWDEQKIKDNIFLFYNIPKFIEVHSK